MRFCRFTTNNYSSQTGLWNSPVRPQFNILKLILITDYVWIGVGLSLCGVGNLVGNVENPFNGGFNLEYVAPN